MKKLFIIANWKAQKTSQEARDWLEKFLTYNNQHTTINNKEIIVCPPFTLLPMMRDFVEQNGLPLKLGAQDVSPYGMGAYTGEVTAEQLKEFVDYVIIGHSERRAHFHETDEMVARKVGKTKDYGLIPIICVQGIDTSIPAGVEVIAYEPGFAIGSGNPDTPENADAVAKEVKDKHGAESVLYGGSVTSENVASFTSQEHIDGVLIGGASLDASAFIKIVQNA